MPRFFRLAAPGTVQHLIARIVNHRFRIAGDDERAEYLRRLGRQAAATDWVPLAYAVMSNHVHLVAVAGTLPVARFLHPLHTGYARWLNRRHGDFGPVFAERYTSIVVDDGRVVEVIVYLHNNPVRAGVFATATDAPLLWTSHGAYIGRDEPPPWLDVTRGLAAGGFARTRAGRRAFDALVRERAGEPRRDELSQPPVEQRKVARRVAGVPVELSSPVLADGGQEVALYTTALTSRPRWGGDPRRALAALVRYTGVRAEKLVSASRERRMVDARRLGLFVWTRLLHRELNVFAGVLGLSTSAASQLLRGRDLDAALHSDAEVLAELLWADHPEAADGRNPQ